MKLQTEGRRIYFIGAPFSAKDQIKNLGASWDADKKSWWIGTGKRDAAEALVARLSSVPSAPKQETVAPDALVLTGRATYKDQSYYVLWSGRDRETGQPKAKLCSLDGRRTFWTPEGEPFEIVKLYKKPQSIDGLKEFAARKAREQKTGVCECRCHSRADCTCKSGGLCHVHHDGCDACQCEG